VYINRDLSSTAAKLVYERREKRRRRQSTSARANVEQPVNTATLTLTNTQQIWNTTNTQSQVRVHPAIRYPHQQIRITQYQYSVLPTAPVEISHLSLILILIL